MDLSFTTATTFSGTEGLQPARNREAARMGRRKLRMKFTTHSIVHRDRAIDAARGNPAPKSRALRRARTPPRPSEPRRAGASRFILARNFPFIKAPSIRKCRAALGEAVQDTVSGGARGSHGAPVAPDAPTDAGRREPRRKGDRAYNKSLRGLRRGAMKILSKPSFRQSHQEFGTSNWKFQGREQRRAVVRRNRRFLRPTPGLHAPRVALGRAFSP